MVGLGLPMLAALFSIPILISELGVDCFGLLTLIWAVVSYFGLFDLGLGRALTLQVAQIFVSKDHEQLSPLIATALALMSILGIFSGLLIAILAPWMVHVVDGAIDKQEAINAAYAMAFAMPAIILTSALRGILEANHSFGIVNLIRLPMGLFTFLGPLLVVVFYVPRLDYIAIVLAIGRIVACIVHAWYAWRILPINRGSLTIKYKLLKPLLATGGWMTVSNVISPFMGYVDRFIVGAIVSASAVTYYATPNEIVTKLWIIPGALTAVLFPTFAAQVIQRGNAAWELFSKSIHMLYVAMLPISLSLMLFAYDLLAFWLNPNLAGHSAVILQIFAAGIFVNCLAHVPFVLIQSAGKSRLAAMIHTSEFPFFIGVLWWLTSTYGVKGAAIAWLIRMMVDTTLMFLFSSALIGRKVGDLLNTKVFLLLLLAAVSFAGVLFESTVMRLVWLIISTLIVFTTLIIHKNFSNFTN